jgi:hypothetical protein
MPRHDSNRRKPAAAALALALLCGLLLAACGGGSSTSTSSASSTKASTNGRGQFAARAAALRTCLKKEGITLPERKPGKTGGQRPGGPFGAGGAGGTGGFQLPKGVTREKLQAALKKCGGGNFARGGQRFGGARNAQALAKFATCMRSNGVKLPAPNTSGKGPIFDTKGIDTTSSAFKQADAKCVKDLRPSGAGNGGSGGAPGTAGPGAGAPGGEAGAPGGQAGALGGEPSPPATAG